MRWNLMAFRLFYLEEDKGAGGGGKTSNEDGKKAESEKKGTEDGDQNKKPDSEKKEEKKPEKTFTQAELDDIIKKRLDRVKDDADAETKKKQGEFETLYNSEKTKREDLEKSNDSLQKDRDSLAETFNKGIDSQIKDWPDELKAMDPGKDNIKARQEWVEKASKLVSQIGNSDGKKKAPNGENGDKKNAGNKGGSDPVARANYRGPVLPKK